jgi:hypothetical protein
MAQGPLGRDPNGQFLVPGIPERVLYAEPLRRRLRSELGGRTVVQSDDAVLLFEPGRYDIGAISNAAWSYRAPFEDMAAIGEMVSFEPDRVEVTLDGERLQPERGRTVVSHGIDRDLSIDEAARSSPRARPEVAALAPHYDPPSERRSLRRVVTPMGRAPAARSPAPRARGGQAPRRAQARRAARAAPPPRAAVGAGVRRRRPAVRR